MHGLLTSAHPQVQYLMSAVFLPILKREFGTVFRPCRAKQDGEEDSEGQTKDRAGSEDQQNTTTQAPRRRGR